jgi:hypothetical protein
VIAVVFVALAVALAVAVAAVVEASSLGLHCAALAAVGLTMAAYTVQTSSQRRLYFSLRSLM